MSIATCAPMTTARENSVEDDCASQFLRWWQTRRLIPYLHRRGEVDTGATVGLHGEWCKVTRSGSHHNKKDANEKYACDEITVSMTHIDQRGLFFFSRAAGTPVRIRSQCHRV